VRGGVVCGVCGLWFSLRALRGTGGPSCFCVKKKEKGKWRSRSGLRTLPFRPSRIPGEKNSLSLFSLHTRHQMAGAKKGATVLVKLASAAGTGFFYVKKKNPRTLPRKLEVSVFFFFFWCGADLARKCASGVGSEERWKPRLDRPGQRALALSSCVSSNPEKRPGLVPVVARERIEAPPPPQCFSSPPNLPAIPSSLRPHQPARTPSTKPTTVCQVRPRRQAPRPVHGDQAQVEREEGWSVG
jgi:ribosomal protein L33